MIVLALEAVSALLRTSLGRWVIGSAAALVALWVWGAWQHHAGLSSGRAEISAEWAEANVRAKREADERDRKAADHRAAEEATTTTEMDRLRQERQEALDAYEREIADRKDGCTVTDDDLRRLRSIRRDPAD